MPDTDLTIPPESVTLTFLGTGTSHGIPQLRCSCRVCRSTDPADTRRRSSALVSVGGKNLLIDCGPDFREQMLHLGSPDIDAVLLTHEHYDHTGGLDDLRLYSPEEGTLPVYCRSDVARHLHERLPYCFGHIDYPGVPRLSTEIIGDEPFMVAGIPVTPLPVMHGKLPITGFLIGNMAYVTDCKTMPESTAGLIRDNAATLVINALRHKEHPMHMNLTEALHVIEVTAPEKAYLTHICHELGLQKELDTTLPEGIRAATDFLCIRT